MLPLALPSLLAGAAMSWARALGEFGATITFAGNLPGITQTMPLAVYIALQSDLDAAIALSVLLLAVSVAVLLGRSRCAPARARPADRRCSSPISLAAGAFELAVELTAAAGETTVLVGESGAGKTTILRLLAGLDRPDRGRITLDGEVLRRHRARGAPSRLGARRRATSRRTTRSSRISPSSRTSPSACARRGAPRRDRARRGRGALARAGVAELGRPPPRSSPAASSSASRWRARWCSSRDCCCSTSRCRRSTCRPGGSCAASCAGSCGELSCVTIYVTHSPRRGARLRRPDRGGRGGDASSQAGSRDELLRRPRSRYVAELIGTNLFRRPVGERSVSAGAAVVRTADGRAGRWARRARRGHGVRGGEPEGDHAVSRASRRERPERFRRPGARAGARAAARASACGWCWGPTRCSSPR